ncbi:hypothetical protein M3D75_02860 [Microbacterium enclense]|uniref:hypothetical protein n=1 Tax=Microbacterium enclense TaxID=993073 RepID=UPI0021A6C385|nr:hypothetical protein [Microbacterium enclense]MCT2085048.1 hypothetical protein [Microbacterium enclense]
MRELKTLTGSTIVISTPDADLRGVVESASRQFVTLADVEAVSGPEPVALSGFVLVPVSRISYIQVVPR